MEILELLLFCLVCLPFIASFALLAMSPHQKNKAVILSAIIAAFIVFYSLFFYPALYQRQIIALNWPLASFYGLEFSLEMDGLGFLFCLLISLIGLLIIIYAKYYMRISDNLPRFLAYLLGFMGSMLGLALAANLIVFLLFWELTSLFSFLLISFWHHKPNNLAAAKMSFTVSFIGGLALFLAILLIGMIVGSYDFASILAARDKLLNHSYFRLILFCILFAAFSKSAQYPFHFWLVAAMGAPTPVSAYLHSATMVKAGILLLARFWPIFSLTPEWFFALGIIGLLSLTLGAYMAIWQHDLKALLAYSTISHLGLILTLLSLASPLASIAAIFHIINHAVFKSSLFMAGGIIEHETGTRDMRYLSGLFPFMPITATLVIVAGAAQAGVPLLNGFLSKEMFFAQAFETHRISLLDSATPYIATIAGIFSVIYSLRLVFGLFFGPLAKDLAKEPQEPPYSMRWPIEFLVFVCIVIGIFPNFTVKPLLEIAAFSLLQGNVPTYSLALWHGWSPALAMSLIALGAGILLYYLVIYGLRGRVRHLNYYASAAWLAPFTAAMIFGYLGRFWQRQFAPWAERLLTVTSLAGQMRFILLFVNLLLLTLFIYSDNATNVFHILADFFAAPRYARFSLMFLSVLWLFGGFCAFLLARSAKLTPFISILLLGAVGFVTVSSFLLLNAFDLALTQFLVEIITTILLLLALRWFSPKEALALKEPQTLLRCSDGAIASFCGLSLAFFAYVMMLRGQKANLGIAGLYFLQQAQTSPYGINVVNRILVEFRAFDSLAETTILVLVALMVFGLLRRFRPLAEKTSKRDGDALASLAIAPCEQDLSLLAVLARWLFPFIIALALYSLFHAHDQPGGGFAASIMLALGIILQYLANSARWVERHLRILPMRWMAGGLLLLLISGGSVIFFGQNFLTGFFASIDLPILNALPLSTVFLFDFAIFAAVLGAVILILIALAHQSMRL